MLYSTADDHRSSAEMTWPQLGEEFRRAIGFLAIEVRTIGFRGTWIRAIEIRANGNFRLSGYRVSGYRGVAAISLSKFLR